MLTAPPPPPPPGASAPAPADYLEIDSPSALAPLVQSLRQAEGLSQGELAQLCGVGRRFIYDIERGKPTLRLDKLFGVLQILGVRFLTRGR